MTGVVPAGFDAYVRILHPVDTVGTELVRWRDVAAATGRVVHPLVQWWRLIDAREPFDPRSERWDGGGPETGALDEPDAGVLVELLAGHTSTPDVAYFALWEGSGHFNGDRVTYGVNEGWRYGRRFSGGRRRRSQPVPVTTLAERLVAGPRLRHPGRDYVMLTGSLTEASSIAEPVGSLPWPLSGNLVWPEDRAWCIGTEVDLDSTLVGCTRAAAADILSCEELEAFPIGPAESLQYDADPINT